MTGTPKTGVAGFAPVTRRAARAASSPVGGTGQPGPAEQAPPPAGPGTSTPAGTARRANPAVPAGSKPGLTATAHCQRCDWTAGPGPAGDVDDAARKHTEKPPKHPTGVIAEQARRTA